MRISQAGLDLIKRFEGLSLTAYKDVAGVPTIGYGTTRYPDGSMVRLGDKCTEAQAEEYLRDDVAGCEEAVNQYIGVPLSQAQFDALVSLVYNIGAGAFSESTLRRKLNAGDYQGAAVEFDRWVHAGGRKVGGLIKRRRAERELFESGMAAPMAASGLIGTPPVPEAAYSAPLKQEPALLKIPPWPFNTQPPSEVRMAFPLAALLPSLISAAPDLIRVFGKGERSEQNARAVETVLAVAKEATGAVNEQQAVEMIEAQPEKADAFRAAIKDRWYELAEAGGGGIAAAREYGAKERGDRSPLWNPALWISAAILPLVYFVVYRVIGAEPGVFSEEIRVMVVTAVISGVLGSITGFWLGSSMSSKNKDEALMRK